MRKILLLVILFSTLLFCVNKNETAMKNRGEKKKMNKYISYEEFNKKYNYLSDSQDSDNKLDKYILEKEKNLEIFKKEKSVKKLLENFNEDEKIIQLMKLMIEAKQFENKTMKFSNYNFIGFFEKYLKDDNSLLKNFHKMDMEQQNKYLLRLLEDNFSAEEIRILFDLYYVNGEFGDYDIGGRYGLPKVDKVISEVEKIEPISDKEWVEREMRIEVPKFSNIESEPFSDVYLLKDNRIMILDEQENLRKEIKIKDYKNTEIQRYKGILYVYDDGKVFEYSLRNLDDVKVVNVNYK